MDSFFKYIWLMLADGAEDIILGNKKKYEKRNRNKNTDKEQEKRKKKKKKKNKKKRKINDTLPEMWFATFLPILYSGYQCPG